MRAGASLEDSQDVGATYDAQLTTVAWAATADREIDVAVPWVEPDLVSAANVAGDHALFVPAGKLDNDSTVVAGADQRAVSGTRQARRAVQAIRYFPAGDS